MPDPPDTTTAANVPGSVMPDDVPLAPPARQPELPQVPTPSTALSREDLRAMDHAKLVELATEHGMWQPAMLGHDTLVEAVAFHLLQKGLLAPDPVKPGSVAKRYRVQRLSRLTLDGAIHTLAAGAIITGATHDIAECRRQGVPLEEVS